MAEDAQIDQDGPLHVELIADPGVATRTAIKALAKVDQNGESGMGGRYVITRSTREVPLSPDGALMLSEVIGWRQENESIDLTVVVTEIPRRSGRHPKMAELHPETGLAIISLPALGWLGVAGRLRRILFGVLDALAMKRTAGYFDPRVHYASVRTEETGAGDVIHIAPPWWIPGSARLVLGMVKTNDPLATLPKMSGSLAAASATGAFGIFYSSIWRMAEALPPWRLLLITLLAIATMVLWLLFSNRLWDRPGAIGGRKQATLYTASTVVTLLLGVALLYLALLFGIFIAALIIVEDSYMAEVMGTEVDILNYVDIAWLSASMGTVAGALGSNFDNDADIRRFTHGRREHQRLMELADQKSD